MERYLKYSVWEADMEITVLRKEWTDKSTIGDMIIDDKFYCYTLEDVDRQFVYSGKKGCEKKFWRKNLKVYGRTAIPYGRYEIIINWSNKFQCPMPLLLNVPDYEGVRIHAGNTDADTEGCILVGSTQGKDFIGNSRSTFKSLFPIIRDALKVGKVWLTIGNIIIGA